MTTRRRDDESIAQPLTSNATTATRVLIVDDSELSAKLCSYVLRNQGAEVVAVGDAESAANVIAEWRPDIVLLDIELPGLDGRALTRQLRADPATADITIVAITARAMVDDRARGLAAGCDEYLTKPIDVQTMPLRVFEAHASRSRRT